MNFRLGRILFSFTLFSGLVALLVILAQQFIPAPFIHSTIWICFFFHMATGVLFLLANYLSYQKGDESYAMGALGALMGRFLLSAIFAAVIILGKQAGDRWFVLNFMALYLFFSVFEITVIISNLRAQKNT